MAIDRIGKNPGGAGGVPDLPAAPGARAPGEASAPAAPFAVQPATTPPEGGAAAGVRELESARPALARLRAGEIDARAYVEIKVDEATKHLTGLRASDLETIRSELRHRLSTDPALADLVKQATGTSVDLPEE